MKIEINGLGFLLFILFLALKLMGIITWSWWWVTSPFWVPIVAILVIMSFLFIMKAFLQ